MAETKERGIPIMGPDGEVYDIAPNDVPDAMRHGGKLAQAMLAPSGDQHWVPLDQVEEGLKNGGKLLQNDGTHYPEGTEPTIVGHNSAGQPIWGAPPAAPKEGLVKSFVGALGDAAKGLVQFLNPKASDEERKQGLDTWYDNLLRPFERLSAGNVAEGTTALDAIKKARQTGNLSDISLAAGHTLATLVPGAGPWAAQVGEKTGGQLAEGDYSGAVGTLAGNVAAGAAMEAVPKGIKAVPEMARGRFADFIASSGRLDTPVAPGEMTPRARYAAAKRMGLEPDLAQATNAPGPRMAKTVTARSLAGRGVYENAAQGNVQALHEYAGKMLDEAHPENISREEFGNRTKAAVSAHRAALADEPGVRAATEKVLNGLAGDSQTGEEFGTAAQEALKEHHQSVYSRAQKYLTDALQRQGSMTHLGNVEEAADKIYQEESPYFEQNPWALKTPGMRQAWDIVQQLKSGGSEGHGSGVRGSGPGKATAGDVTAFADSLKPAKGAEPAPSGGGGNSQPQQPGDSHPTDPLAEPTTVKPASRELSPAMVAKMRSDLWNLYQSPELVGSRAEGWLKELTASLDESLTDPANEKGMSPAEIQKFRAGTSLWKRMKTMYDDPQSPFFSIVRSPEPLTAAKTLENLKPTAARQFREAMKDVGRGDLVGQQQRQAATHLLDPSGNGTFDFKGFQTRWQRLPKEQAAELYGTDNVAALGDLADRAGKTTPYDAAGSKLATVADAPNGTAADSAIFTPGNGALKLAPADVQLLEQADPNLIPQLKRQAISRLFDPAENGTPDMKNFASRWNRAQKEPLSAVLSPEQIKDLDDMSEVSRATQANENPSGTSSVVQPVGEAAGLGGAATAALTGHPVPAVVAGLGMGAEYGVSKLMNSPKFTDWVMEHPRPEALAPIVADAAKNTVAEATPVKAVPVGAVVAQPQSQQQGSGGRDQGPDEKPGEPVSQPASQTPATAKSADPKQYEGVSTPPNGGQITDVNKAEPNEVHDATVAAAAANNMLPPEPRPAGGGVARLTNPQGDVEYENPTLEAPQGATHEVLHPETQKVMGHVVDGVYVPLTPQ